MFGYIFPVKPETTVIFIDDETLTTEDLEAFSHDPKE